MDVHTDSMPEPELIVRGADGDRIIVRILRREFPDDHDVWDGNGLIAALDVRVRSFAAQFEGFLRTDELSDFRTGLERLVETGAGTAELDSMEDTVNLRVRIEGDEAEIEGDVTEAPGGWCTLSFRLYVDDLRPMVKQLAEIEREYPVRS